MGQLCQGLREDYCGGRNTEEKLGLMVKEVLKCVLGNFQDSRNVFV